MKTHQKLKNAVLLLIVAFFGVNGLYGADRSIDYAAEDAAYQAVKSLTQSAPDISSIAFIGFTNDVDGLSDVFRAGLIKTPGMYRFYTRRDAEWKKLTDEILFGLKKEDIMDPETIQNFGDVKGVDSLLYGVIRETTKEKSGDGIFRVTLTLARVTTGEILWTGNVEGRFVVKGIAEAVPATLRKAAVEAGRKAAASLENKKTELKHTNLFFLPLKGEKGAALSNIVAAELAKSADENWLFYSAATEADQRAILRISHDLSGTGSAQAADLKRITLQLQQLFTIEEGKAAGTADPEKKTSDVVNAVITGEITQAEHGETTAEVAMTLNVREISGNRILWSDNIEAEFTDRMTVSEKVETEMDAAVRGLTITHILITVVALIALVGIIMIFRMMRRPR